MTTSSSLPRAVARRTGRLLRRAGAVLRATALPPSARVKLLGVAALRRVAPATVVRIDVGPGRLRLAGPDLLHDYTAVFEIFVEQQYAADVAGARVVDLGAHRGYFSACAALGGARTIWSFEPEATNFALLSETADEFRRAGHDWRVERAAVTDVEGRAALHVTSRSWSHSLVERTAIATGATQDVGTRAMASVLDDVAATPGGRVVVKIDVEGSECDVILGTPADAWSLVDELYVEFEGLGACTAPDLVAHLGASGLELRGEARGILHLARGAA
jgi:FkbM family methyltransferase